MNRHIRCCPLLVRLYFSVILLALLAACGQTGTPQAPGITSVTSAPTDTHLNTGPLPVEATTTITIATTAPMLSSPQVEFTIAPGPDLTAPAPGSAEAAAFDPWPPPLPTPDANSPYAPQGEVELAASGEEYVFASWSPQSDAVLIQRLNNASYEIPNTYPLTVWKLGMDLLLVPLAAHAQPVTVSVQAEDALYSPTGRTILYRRYIHDVVPATELYVMPVDRPELATKVAEAPLGNFTWIGPGLIGYNNAGAWTYAAINENDLAAPVITSVPVDFTLDLAPAGPNGPRKAIVYSRDGTAVAYAVAEMLKVIVTAPPTLVPQGIIAPTVARFDVSSHVHNLGSHGAGRAQMAWSPDSRYLAYIDDEGDSHQLKLWDRATNTTREIYRSSFFLLDSPSWFPDGRAIVFGEQAGTGTDHVSIVTVADEHAMVVWSGHFPQLSPDGRKLLVQYMNGSIYVVKLGGRP